MSAKRKTSSSSKKRNYSTNRSKGLIGAYLQQRDAFFVQHPNCRWLLGILIVVFAIAIGLLIYNKNIVFVGLSLEEAGVRYPYVDTTLQKE